MYQLESKAKYHYRSENYKRHEVMSIKLKFT